MLIDASNLIAGRLASFVAKKALLGEKVDIVNAEKAIMTGKKSSVFNDFKQTRERTVPFKGPYIHRSPDRILRRIIRGMLPYKQSRGRAAFERVMCWKGVPVDFKDKKAETIKEADISKVPNLRYVTLADVSKQLGGRVE